MQFDLPTVERDIRGARFKISKLPYKQAKPISFMIGKKVFPLFAAAAANIDFNQALNGVSGADRKAAFTALIAPKFVGVAGELISSLEMSEIETLEQAFGAFSWFQNGTDASGSPNWMTLGNEDNRAVAFRASMSRFYMWLVACLEVSFKDDFFSDLAGHLGQSF